MFDDLATPDITKVPTKRAGYDCPRCRGTGKYTYGYVNLRTVDCGKCRGTGLLKTSPKQRLASRVSSAKAAIKRKEQNVEEFGKREPAALAWLNSNNSDFAASLLDQVKKKGDLSPKQLQAVYQSIAREADWAKQREQKATQTQIDMTDLLNRFALALKAGIKRPKVNTGDLLFSLAPAHGHNAGCVYVKGEKDAYGDRPYLGKITPEGKFFAGRGVEDDVKQRIAEVGSDVVGSAKAHGAQHGNCCFCSRDLTTDESVSNGYGPICADRYGLPWIVREEFKQAKADLKQANQEAAS
jgi:polyhydroxyalkanoate synthesis regulator phasin